MPKKRTKFENLVSLIEQQKQIAESEWEKFPHNEFYLGKVTILEVLLERAKTVTPSR